MAGVEADGDAAAEAAEKDEPTTIVLKMGDESFETRPWKHVADMQSATCESITADSFIDTVEPGAVLAFKDRCSAPDKTALPVSAC